MTTRRAFLQFLVVSSAAGLAAACSQPAAAPPPAPTVAPPKPAATTAPPAPAATAAPAQAAPAKPAAAPTTASVAPVPAEWNALLAAARQEGTVSIATYAGTAQRKVMDAFEAAYPGIKVEQTPFQSSSRDFVPRLLQERQAGLYLWDVGLVPSQEMLLQVRPIGGLQPIRPSIILPDIVDDRYWGDGFEGGFPDNEKRWGYALMRSRYTAVYVNTDLVKDGEITKFSDLLDPKWRGKVTAGDPRTKGSAYLTATAIRLKVSDDAMKQIFVDQEPVIGTDARQLTEGMVRGRFAIGVGAVDDQILRDFQAQGQGKNVQNLPLVETDYVNTSNKTAWMYDRAPHPNAAKVFLNWIMSHDGSLAYSTILADNSRRADVPVQNPDTVVKPGVDYCFVDKEDMLPEIEKTQKLAKDLLH